MHFSQHTVPIAGRFGRWYPRPAVVWCVAVIWLAGACILASAGAGTMQITRTAALDEIHLGKTFVVNDKPMRKVVVGDANIASVRALSPGQLLIKGLRPGMTNLIVWYADDSVPQAYDITVVIDPATVTAAEDLVRELVPTSRVRILPVNAEVLLEGEVQSIADMHRVVQIVRPFFSMPDESPVSEGDEGKTSINISTDGGSDSGAAGNESQLEQNLNMTLAIRNNLVVISGPQQVQLEVKIAEVSRSGIKQMGLAFISNRDWAIGVFSAGEASGRMGAQGSSGFSSKTGTSSTESTVIESAATVAAPFGSAFQVLLHATEQDLLSVLSLMKSQGLARILAEPTLVTMSGQKARFNVGGEFPVPVQGDSGTTTIEFKEYGTLLQFTPVVIDRETISLKVAPMVSSPDYSLGTVSGGTAVPALKTRTAETTLQLRDGQTFVMAGLLQEEVSTNISKIPFLGDLPVVGNLFSNKEFRSSETELIILVTPRLVRALDAADVPVIPDPMPFGSISDVDFFILNRLYNRIAGTSGSHSATAAPAAPLFSGETGFSR